MRKSPEALDDVVMALRVVEKALVVLAPGRHDLGAQAMETFDRQPLQGGILRVLQRQVEERARGGYESAIEAARDAIDGEALRRVVLRERADRAAVDVAGELVEQDDQRKAAAR